MTTTVRQALTSVLAAELAADPAMVVLGETVRDGGAAGVTAGLFEWFGERRVVETPVSENGILGAALGLALDGFRPVVEIYSADFLLAVANELVNDIAKWRAQQARPGPLPIVVRGCMGANSGLGPEHSQCMEAYLHHAPGLVVVAPGTPEDAVGLLRASLRSDDPVVFLEHRRLYPMPAASTVVDGIVPIGRTAHVRTGDGVTLVAWSWMRQEAEAAADELAREGIGVDLFDPRTVKPLDLEPIVASVRRTGRLVVAEESFVTGSVGAEIVARVVEELEGERVRAVRVAMPDVIHPYGPALEAELLPDATAIVTAVRKVVGG